MEQNRINLFQGLKADGNYTKGYTSFIQQYFSSENGTKDIWNKLIDGGDYTKPFSEFAKKYACDLEWAKDLTYCGGTGAKPVVKPVVTPPVKTDPKTPTTPTKPTLTPVTLTGDDIKAGKTVKIGMKGDIVGDIQALLYYRKYTNISKTGKVDKVFGTRTKASVQEFQTNNGLTADGVVGKETWAKLNDAKAISKDNTQKKDNSGTGDLQGTGDTYVSGSDAVFSEKNIPDALKESIKKTLRKSLLKYKK